MNRFSILVWVALIMLTGVPSYSEAAALYIDPATSELYRGDAISMAVRLDTDEAAGECVNAVDAVLFYSDNIEPVDISTGQSIFNIWVEQPRINKENRTITFAGGIPNGYCGRISGDPRLTNILAEVIFRSPGFTIGGGDSDSKVATVDFSDSSTAYLNDGRGTKAKLATYGATVQLDDRAGSVLDNPWKDEIVADVIPPEKFTIELVKGDGNFSNKYYILFSTTDKQSGIDHYEVIEEPLSQLASFEWGRADAPWFIAEQPPVFVLKDQTLNSSIRVKAVDKAGNFYVATIVPDKSLRTYSESGLVNRMGLIGGVLIIVTLLFAVALSLRSRKKQKVSDEEDEADDFNLDED